MKYAFVVGVVVAACTGTRPSHAPDAMPGDAIAADANPADGAPDGAPQQLDPSHCSLTTDRDVAVAGVDAVTVTITIRDTANQPIANTTVQLVVTGTGNAVVPPTLTDAAGISTAQVMSTVAESKDITALISSTVIGAHTVTFVPGPAQHLELLVPPGDTYSGAPFTPAIQVAAEDAHDNLVTAAVGVVTLALGSNPGNAQLGGTTTVPLTNGVATFADDHIDVAGTGYTLVASAPGITPVTSDPFDITTGTPDPAHCTIDATPPSVEADGVSTSTITVHVADTSGAPVAYIPVSFTVTGSNNTLTPMSAMANASGVATASLASTTAEVKTVTATIASVTLTAPVRFYPVGCHPQLPGEPWSALDYRPDAVLVTDLDNDGHQDVVVSEAFHDVLVYRGRGDGTFLPPFVIASATGVSAIAAGDIDADGVLDLIIAQTGPVGLLYARGLGGGQFFVEGVVQLDDIPTALALGDVDHNGTLDIAVSIPGRSEALVELGDGTGAFTPGPTLGYTALSDVALVDVDHDGNLDLLTSDGAKLYVALGDGAGAFASPLVSSEPAGYGKMFAGDLNRDGTTDLLLTDGDAATTMLGNGDGTFRSAGGVVFLASNYDQEYVVSLVDGGSLVDLDGDGDLDAVLESGGALSVLTNAGDGTFSLTRSYVGGTTMGYADVDEDGVGDVVALGAHSYGVIDGEAGGRFVAPDFYPRPSGRMFAAAGDFDGNGQLDIVRYDALNGYTVGLTHPDGSLTDAATGGGAEPDSLVVEDATGDGHADVVSLADALMGRNLFVVPGRGDGTFLTATYQTFMTGADTIAAASFGPDNRGDLVFTDRFTAGFWISLSQPNGTFGTLQAVTGASHWVVVADVNADGFSDVLTADASGDLAVYLGNGVGGVAAPVSYATHGFQGALAIGDVDGDTRLDAVILAQDPTTHLVSIVVLRGLGGGAFGPPLITPITALPADLQQQDLRLDDFTRDGALDVGLSTDRGFAIISGFGDGYFREHAWYYGLAGYTGSPAEPSVVVSDRNLDGVPDLTFWSRSGIGVALTGSCVP